MSRELALVTLGCAIRDADLGVGEEGGNNEGPRIREFLANTDPPINIAAPWCAAAVQYWSDLAARRLKIPNPLDEVRLEAYVQNYFDTLRHLEIAPGLVQQGDLVLFSFGGERWDHIGLVVTPPSVGVSLFETVEGNTSAESERDGDAVAVKARRLDAGYRVTFIDWARDDSE